MITKTKVLKFDKQAWRKPIVCELARNFDISFSILKAKVLPRQEGLMILEISGFNGEFLRAQEYLRSIPGVTVEALEQDIVYDAETCTHCGACTGFCPSGALHIADRTTMEVSFDPDACIGCEICLAACPARALSLAEGVSI